ncbi:MAG: hypothetical protein JSR50_06895 [Proteobacteria bacterium]|nr:hypothetical protein [Pseudomonadota bacterium]
MARIEIPENFIAVLGPEMSMDVHWIDVKLKDGRDFKNLVVRGGRYITGKSNDPEGIGNLNFTSSDIQTIRRHRSKPSNAFIVLTIFGLVAAVAISIWRAV